MHVIRWLAAIVIAALLVTSLAAAAGQTRVLAKSTTKYSLAIVFIVSSDGNASVRTFGYRVTTSPAHQKAKLSWFWDCSGTQDAKGTLSRSTPYTVWKALPASGSECGARANANRTYGAPGSLTVQILGR